MLSPDFTYSACLCLVSQSCATPCNPLDCSLEGSSGHGTLQTRIMEWVSSSGGFSQPRCWTSVSSIAGRLFTHWAIWENTKISWEGEKKKNFHFYQWFKRSSLRIKPSGSFSLCFITFGQNFLGKLGMFCFSFMKAWCLPSQISSYFFQFGADKSLLQMANEVKRQPRRHVFCLSPHALLHSGAWWEWFWGR